MNWDRSKPENEYAAGELIAELSSCFTMGELGLATTDDLTNHTAYIKHWLEAMRNDVSFIFKAVSQSNRVCDYLQSFVDEPIDEPAS